VDEGEYVISKTEITTVEEKMEFIVGERKIREEESWHAPEIPPPPTITYRDDDWFVLLDVIPRKTTYVPPGTAKIPLHLKLCLALCLLLLLKQFLFISVAFKGQDQMEAESFVSVAGAAADEIREVVVEERKIIEEAPRHPQEILLQPVTERDDDWFVLLDVVPRVASYVPPGTATILLHLNLCFVLHLLLVLKLFLSILVFLKERDQMEAESFVSVIGTSADQEIREVVVEERKIIEEAPRQPQEILLQPVTERDDDWFVLLDVVPRVASYVPPGTATTPLQFKLCLALCLLLLLKLFLFISVTFKGQDQMDAESFVSVIGTSADQEIREIIVEERKIIEEAPRQPQEILLQPVTERDDDWFVLLDVFPRVASYVPPGTATTLLHLNLCFVLHLLLVLKLSLSILVFLKERDQMEAESFVSVAGAAAHEIREVAVEERKIIEEAPRRPQEILLQPMTDRDDDWFVLLDVVPRETSYVPPGTAAIPCTASQLYKKQVIILILK